MKPTSQRFSAVAVLTLAVLAAGPFRTVHGADPVKPEPVKPIPAPVAQPTLTATVPSGIQRGTSLEMSVVGRSLAPATAVRVDARGVTAELVPLAENAKPNASLVKVKLTASPDAELGIHELRLLTPGGSTNVVRFAVGTLTETSEVEPNEDDLRAVVLPTLPAIVNGTISRGEDRDCYRFSARAGQTLVFDLCGQQLHPYISGLRPGWFEGLLTLRRADEIAPIADAFASASIQITEKTAASRSAAATIKAAQTAAARVAKTKAAADKATADKAKAAKTAADSAAKAKAVVDKTTAEKLAAEKVVAAKAATETATTASDKAATEAAKKAADAKTTADKSVVAQAAALKAAAQGAATAKAAADNANAASAAAAKAAADSAAKAKAVVDKATAEKAAADKLAAEKAVAAKKAAEEAATGSDKAKKAAAKKAADAKIAADKAAAAKAAALTAATQKAATDKAAADKATADTTKAAKAAADSAVKAKAVVDKVTAEKTAADKLAAAKAAAEKAATGSAKAAKEAAKQAVVAKAAADKVVAAKVAALKTASQKAATAKAAADKATAQHAAVAKQSEAQAKAAKAANDKVAAAATASREIAEALNAARKTVLDKTAEAATLRAQARLAFSSDSGYGLDPVLIAKIPKDGQYVIEVRDELYRGRGDFNYRLTLGELPHVTSSFPAGAKRGTTTQVQVKGVNLGSAAAIPVAIAGDAAIGRKSVEHVKTPLGLSNAVALVPGNDPEVLEVEPNNDATSATASGIPATLNGTIERDGDYDWYKFTTTKGQRLIFVLVSQSLGSPLDGRLDLYDTRGRRLRNNDDANSSADAYVDYTFPADGEYLIRVGDATSFGGSEYVYRLDVHPPRPDFSLTVSPDNPRVTAGGTIGLTVLVQRREGFASDIEISVPNAPAGTVIPPTTLTNGQAQVVLSMTMPETAPEGMTPISIIGKAKVGETEITHKATPTERVRYVNSWRYMPVADLLLNVLPKAPFTLTWGQPTIKLVQGKRIKVPVTIHRTEGFTGRVRVTVQGLPSGTYVPPIYIQANSDEGVVEIISSGSARVGLGYALADGSATVERRGFVQSSPALKIQVVAIEKKKK